MYLFSTFPNAIIGVNYVKVKVITFNLCVICNMTVCTFSNWEFFKNIHILKLIIYKRNNVQLFTQE
jgi:hypothetical protein